MVHCILLSLPRVVDLDGFWCRMHLQWRLGRCRSVGFAASCLTPDAGWYVPLGPLIIASQICSNPQPLKVQGFKTTVWPTCHGYCLCLWDKNTRILLCKSPGRVGGPRSFHIVGSDFANTRPLSMIAPYKSIVWDKTLLSLIYSMQCTTYICIYYE